MTVNELIIIGGGPAAYTAALYASRGNLAPLVFEGFEHGGQLMITTDVDNYPGFPEGIMGPELMVKFREQSARFGPQLVSDDVTRVEFSDDPINRPHRVFLGEQEHQAHAVIIATGAKARQIGARVGAQAAGPRRLVLRDLRRRLLPRTSAWSWSAAATRPWRRRPS